MSDNDVRQASEYGFLRVPYEVATSGILFVSSDFKKTRKDAERELNQVLSSIITLKNNLTTGKEEALKGLQSNQEKLTALKRRLTEDYLRQNSLYDSMRKRVNHLSAASIDVRRLVSQESAYVKTKINRLIVEYFLLRKRFDEAEALSKLLHIEDFCECERTLVQQLYTVVEALQDKDLVPAKKWYALHPLRCQDNRSKLSKSSSLLEFKLVLMEFSQLLQANRKSEAIEFIR